MSKDPIHLLYKQLFQIGKKFDQYPVFKLFAKDTSKKLNRIRSLNEPFTPLLYQRFISEKANNWTHSSEDFELFREFSYSLKYAESKVKWFVDVPMDQIPKPTVDMVDFNNIKEGNILVAHPSLENTNYQQAVVLLLAVSPQEIVGITINKPSHKNIYDGGPVKNYTSHDTKLIALFSKENLFKDGMKIAPSLYYVVLKKKELEGINPSDYVLFFGTMRWGRSQLKNEIENDSWVLLDCPLEHIYKPVSKSYTEIWKKDENGNDYLLIENLSKHGKEIYDSEISRQQALFKEHFNNNEMKRKNENNDENDINKEEEVEKVNINQNPKEENTDKFDIQIENIKQNDNNDNKKEEENEIKSDVWPKQEKNEKIEDWVNRVILIENSNIGSKIKQNKMINSKLRFQRLRELFQENEDEREKEEGERELKLVGWAHPKVLWNHLLTLIGGEISLGIYCFEKTKN
jgi:putative AlgH/UPF0301 family transcriptional regulator